MPKFKDAPDGQRSSIDGTEVVPLGSSDETTSWWAYLSTIADFIVTNNGEVIVHNGNVVTLG